MDSRFTRCRETRQYGVWCTLLQITGCLLKSTAVLHSEACINCLVFPEGKMILGIAHPGLQTAGFSL